jgi:hypothetical protein
MSLVGVAAPSPWVDSKCLFASGVFLVADHGEGGGSGWSTFCYGTLCDLWRLRLRLWACNLRNDDMFLEGRRLGGGSIGLDLPTARSHGSMYLAGRKTHPRVPVPEIGGRLG